MWIILEPCIVILGKNVNKKAETEDEMESQWVFPKREPTEQQKRMIVARVGETLASGACN